MSDLTKRGLKLNILKTCLKILNFLSLNPTLMTSCVYTSHMTKSWNVIGEKKEMGGYSTEFVMKLLGLISWKDYSS